MTSTSMNININTSPSLHPEVVRAIEGYDADTEADLDQVVAAFDAAYSAIGSVHAARAAAASNPALTEDAKLLQVAAFAQKRQATVFPKFDAAMRNVQSSISCVENALARPLQAASQALGAEIRQHVAKMSPSERHAFIQQRAAANDTVSIAALLSAPAYLTNMTDQEQASHLRTFHSHRDPSALKRLTVLRQAEHLLGERGGLVLQEFQRAVGAAPAKVEALRTRVAAAEAAFR